MCIGLQADRAKSKCNEISRFFQIIIVYNCFVIVLLHMISVNVIYVKNVDGLGNHVSKESQRKVFLSHCLTNRLLILNKINIPNITFFF